jgi:hypothetical protein
MFFKKAKNTPASDQVVPDGWKVEVRPQNRSYGVFWEYRLTPPTRILNMYDVGSYTGSEYKTKQLAIAEAVSLAKFVERNCANKTVSWETI